MTLVKILLACLACGAAIAGPPGASALAATAEKCAAPESGAKEAPMFSPAVLDVVIGTGRLQFYSAPNVHCAMDGVFVIPKDNLVEYARTNDGWSSVMYFSGSSPQGWVRSARLKLIGTVGPKQ
jgi:hypothetical protein